MQRLDTAVGGRPLGWGGLGWAGVALTADDNAGYTYEIALYDSVTQARAGHGPGGSGGD